MSRLQELHKFGQSPWYDNIERGFLLSGKLRRLIEEDGITGLTSNPSIFEKAIGTSAAYNEEIAVLARQGKDTQAVYDELTTKDITLAAEALKGVYHSSGKIDGFVSIEVSPHLAHDAAGTLADARRLCRKIAVENLMIKIPATSAGVEAVRQLTAEGMNINATLIFSQAHYTAVAQAYLDGLRQRLKNGHSIDKINSVASFFVSRIDSAIDKKLRVQMEQETDPQKKQILQALLGKTAVAQSKVVYGLYRTIFYGEDFKRLREKGANVQRLLFGSTSTKDPAYSDVKYVEEIIGEGTINTLPEATVEAFRDHGKAKASLGVGEVEAKQVLQKLQALGISVEEVCQTIQAEGLAAFVQAYDKLLKTLAQKQQQFLQ